jgi:hypothetical protein
VRGTFLKQFFVSLFPLLEAIVEVVFTFLWLYFSVHSAVVRDVAANGKALQQLQRESFIWVIQGFDQNCYQSHIDIPMQFPYCVGAFHVSLFCLPPFSHPKSSSVVLVWLIVRFVLCVNLQVQRECNPNFCQPPLSCLLLPAIHLRSSSVCSELCESAVVKNSIRKSPSSIIFGIPDFTKLRLTTLREMTVQLCGRCCRC